MNNILKRSKLIKERMVSVTINGELTYQDELELMEFHCNRLNLTTPAQLAREKGISFNGMKQRIQTGKEMTIKLNGIQLICN